MSKEFKIMAGIALVVVAGGALLFLKGNPPAHVAPADAGKLVRDDSDMSGSKDAKVTLVEFGDYQCPFCGELHPTIKQLLATYKDNQNFNFVFRNFPLSQHQFAQIAAEAAEAAGAQGKFWEMHDMIYENQNQWVPSSNPLDLFVTYAQTLGLNTDQFRADVQSNKYQDKIANDTDDANALGVNATPTLYLDGTQINTGDYNTLKSQIDQELSKYISRTLQ